MRSMRTSNVNGPSVTVGALLDGAHAKRRAQRLRAQQRRRARARAAPLRARTTPRDGARARPNSSRERALDALRDGGRLRGELRLRRQVRRATLSAARCAAMPRSRAGTPKPSGSSGRAPRRSWQNARNGQRAWRPSAPVPPGHARAGERRRVVRDRFARARRAAAEPPSAHRARPASKRRPIANRGARLRLVVVDARRPADDELAAAPDEPLERARGALLRVARRRVRHAVRALQRDGQQRIAARRLGPRGIGETRDPDGVVTRADVVDARAARARRARGRTAGAVRSSKRASSANAASSEISPTIGVSRDSSSSVLCHASNAARAAGGCQPSSARNRAMRCAHRLGVARRMPPTAASAAASARAELGARAASSSSTPQRYAAWNESCERSSQRSSASSRARAKRSSRGAAKNGLRSQRPKVAYGACAVASASASTAAPIAGSAASVRPCRPAELGARQLGAPAARSRAGGARPPARRRRRALAGSPASRRFAHANAARSSSAASASRAARRVPAAAGAASVSIVVPRAASCASNAVRAGYGSSRSATTSRSAGRDARRQRRFELGAIDEAVAVEPRAVAAAPAQERAIVDLIRARRARAAGSICQRCSNCHAPGGPFGRARVADEVAAFGGLRDDAAPQRQRLIRRQRRAAVAGVLEPELVEPRRVRLQRRRLPGGRASPIGCAARCISHCCAASALATTIVVERSAARARVLGHQAVSRRGGRSAICSRTCSMRWNTSASRASSGSVVMRK